MKILFAILLSLFCASCDTHYEIQQRMKHIDIIYYRDRQAPEICYAFLPYDRGALFSYIPCEKIPPQLLDL